MKTGGKLQAPGFRLQTSGLYQGRGLIPCPALWPEPSSLSPDAGPA